MSELIESGYAIIFNISNIRSIKVTPSGDVNGTKYKGSVKFKSVNIEQEDTPDYGLTERETVIEFKIPGEDKDLRIFNQFLRDLQKANKPLALSGSIPRQSQGQRDSYTVTSYQTCVEIVALHTTPKTTK